MPNSWLFQAINELSELLDFPASSIIYVMTDFTWNNLKFWNGHKNLRRYIDSGQLDVAIFDAVNDDSIKCVSVTIHLKTAIMIGFIIPV